MLVDKCPICGLGSCADPKRCDQVYSDQLSDQMDLEEVAS